MHHMYNLDYYTTDNTLPLKSNVKWVTPSSDMHVLFMIESLVSSLNTWTNTPLSNLMLVPPSVGIILNDFNSVKIRLINYNLK